MLHYFSSIFFHTLFELLLYFYGLFLPLRRYYLLASLFNDSYIIFWHMLLSRAWPMIIFKGASRTLSKSRLINIYTIWIHHITHFTNNILSELKIDFFRSAQMQCATYSPTEQPKYRYDTYVDRHCEPLKVPAEIVIFIITRSQWCRATNKLNRKYLCVS